MKVDFVSSRVCLGGLPGPLVPGFLGELVTCCGGRRERGGGRRRERAGGRERRGGRGRKEGWEREEGRKWRENSKDGAAVLYSQVFLHVYKMGSPFPSLVWQLFFSLGMSTHPRYHLTPPGHCPVESCSWGNRDILEVYWDILRYTRVYWGILG